MTASTGLSHPSGQCAGLPTRRVPFSTTTPFNHGSEVPESAGLRQANYGEKHCRQSAKWGKAGPPGPAARTTQTWRLVATGSGDKPQLRCLVVTYARVRFLHLHGSPDTLASRIGARTDHFMPSLAADVPNGNFRAADSRRGGNLIEVRGELRGLKVACCHVFVRLQHLPPRLEPLGIRVPCNSTKGALVVALSRDPAEIEAECADLVANRVAKADDPSAATCG
jgi:hypothetical protein